MPVEKRLRKIFGPFVFLFGLGLLIGDGWILLSLREESVGLRLLSGVVALVFSSAFLFVGYDWMRGRTSTTLPRLSSEDDT
jgi:hypothetical protein